MDHYQEFKLLHEQKNPLQIGNVWDVQSALLFEKMNYKALGTSSAAIANSLGYEDGEQMRFEELHVIVKSIAAKVVAIPLTVDIEAGYSRDTNEIIENIVLLSQEGVVGINLEDSVVEDGNREIVDSDSFSETIKAIKKYLFEKEINIFLNIRTDPYIIGLDNALSESITRAGLYEKAGADGIFVPCITHDDDIKSLVDSVSLPVNVMAMPNLPSISKLEWFGVKRISMGPFVYNKMNEHLKNILGDIQDNQSFNCLFATR